MHDWWNLSQLPLKQFYKFLSSPFLCMSYGLEKELSSLFIGNTKDISMFIFRALNLRGTSSSKETKELKRNIDVLFFLGLRGMKYFLHRWGALLQLFLIALRTTVGLGLITYFRDELSLKHISCGNATRTTFQHNSQRGAPHILAGPTTLTQEKIMRENTWKVSLSLSTQHVVIISWKHD